MELGQNVERARSNLTESAHDDTAARGGEVVPVPIEERVLEEGQGRLKTHFRERTDVALETITVEWSERAIPCHVVADEVQMTLVDADTVTVEHTSEFEDDALSRRFHSVYPQDSGDIVGLDGVGINEVAIFLHRF
ncbi:hypothetical protein RRF57_010740 [Xylaria bambusicola]|uniref:Uncharacterized protein n=1 Tax=Xylaria bambusicola TaxID=326684 RepID=A0AAN7UX27_9PEZI